MALKPNPGICSSRGEVDILYSIKRFFLLLLLAASSVHLAHAELPEEEEPVNINPHVLEVKEYCGVCHARDIPELNHDPVTTCTRCHPGNSTNHPVAGHPMGVVPRISISVELRLSGEEEVVCHTCHEPHGETPYPKMLRVEYEKLCAACHAGY